MLKILEAHDHATSCGCGKSYTVTEFRALEPARGGLVMLFEDGGKPDGIEMRNCSCKSTLAVAFVRVGAVSHLVAS